MNSREAGREYPLGAFAGETLFGPRRFSLHSKMTIETPKTSNFQLFLRVIRRQDALRSKLPLLSVLLLAYVAFNVSEPYFYKLFIDVVDSVLS